MENKPNIFMKLMIRIYFYLTRGADVINTFRNPVLLIFGFCWTFKQKYPILEDLKFITILGLASIVFMIVLGALMVHLVGKYIDYLNVKHSTYWAKYGYELQEKQNSILLDIKEGVDKSNQTIR